MSGLIVDYRNPDYTPILVERARRLAYLRNNPREIVLLKRHYATHTAAFIDDWAMTIDPRVLKPRAPLMPFLLFPRQFELIQWIEARHADSETGVMVKARDVGASWVAMAWAVSKCLFNKDFMVGVGSAKEDKVDRSGDPDTLFYKARMFLQWLPEEFRCGWELNKHSAHMRLVFPATNSSVTGEAGDNIGRGGRKTVYFVDESAHVERPKLIDASLAATTECRIDMSSVNTMANSFADKAHQLPKHQRFDFSWTDDPRKDREWYEKKKRELDPVIVRQEIDCDFNASAENVVIPSEFVAAAIGLAERLGIKPNGVRRNALDIADLGGDKNALASRIGCQLDKLSSWRGDITGDISATITKAIGHISEWGSSTLEYDADGMGANARGVIRTVNEQLTKEHPRGFRRVAAVAFHGSGEVLWKEKKARRSDLKNEDMFANYKAQSWWHLYTMFAESFKAASGEEYDEDMIISLDPKLPELSALKSELSQPKWKWQNSGKRLVDKVPDGSHSPNLADAVMMAFAPRKGPLNISDETVRNMST